MIGDVGDSCVEVFAVHRIELPSMLRGRGLMSGGGVNRILHLLVQISRLCVLICIATFLMAVFTIFAFWNFNKKFLNLKRMNPQVPCSLSKLTAHDPSIWEEAQTRHEVENHHGKDKSSVKGSINNFDNIISKRVKRRVVMIALCEKMIMSFLNQFILL